MKKYNGRLLARGAVGIALMGLLILPKQVLAAGSVAGEHLVSVVRSGRTTFDYTYTLVVSNAQPALNSAQIAAVSSAPGTTILKGSVSVGAIPAGATVTTTDTLVFRQDRTVPFSWSSIAFTVVPGQGAVAQGQITAAAGGTVTANDPGDPVSGTAVVFPAGALGDPTDTITIGYSNSLPAPLNADATAAGVAPVSKVVTLTRTGTTPFRLDVTVTIPYSTSAVGGQDYPVVLYWDPTLLQYQPVQVLSVDRSNGLITFSTKHFSSYIAVALKGLASALLGGTVPLPAALTAINTGFDPGLDGFEIQNISSGVKGVANGGACFGLSSYAGWYFAAKPSPTRLFQEYKTSSDAGVTHIPQEDAIARELVAKAYADTVNDFEPLQIPDVLTATEFVLHLLITKDPQLAYVYFLNAKGAIDSHSVLVYAFDAPSLSFAVYDPNVPAPMMQPTPIQWKFPGGGFDPWSSGGYTFTKIEFDAYGTHFDEATLKALFSSVQGGGPPADSFGAGWNFNTLTVTGAGTPPVPYPGSAQGPTVAVDAGAGTELKFNWSCATCLAGGPYYLHVLQYGGAAGSAAWVPLLSDQAAAAAPISNGGSVSVTTTPFSGNSAELIAFVSTSSSVVEGSALLTNQSDVSLGYSAFQRAELAPLSGELFGFGINGSGTIVGGTCPSGYQYYGYFECYSLSSACSGIQGCYSQPAAAAVINGKRYSLGSLASFAPCGFDASSPSQALGLSQGGSILVEGQRSISNGEGGVSTYLASCLLTPTGATTPQFDATALGTLFGWRLNGAGTIVGGTCPSGYGYYGYFECYALSSTCSGIQGCYSQPDAAALINGKLYSLDSLVSFSPCGFDTSSPSQALAVSEGGAIIVEGQHSTSNGYGGTNTYLVSCLLTPAGTTAPRFTASALGALFGWSLNSSGTIVGGVCPSGYGYYGYFECYSLSSTCSGIEGCYSQPDAAALIGGKLYTLDSVADLAPCGFDSSSPSQALAVSETGAILVEGQHSIPNGYGGENTYLQSCLLTPAAALADGTPQFIASAL